MSGSLLSADMRKDSSSKCLSLLSSGILREVSASALSSFSFSFSFSAGGRGAATGLGAGCWGLEGSSAFSMNRDGDALLSLEPPLGDLGPARCCGGWVSWEGLPIEVGAWRPFGLGRPILDFWDSLSLSSWSSEGFFLSSSCFFFCLDGLSASLRNIVSFFNYLITEYSAFDFIFKYI